MQDRIPLYPGRVKLAPVAGQENTYDMVRADEPQQEGTPLNKNSLLKDSTAAALGLTEDTVPDDAFSKLSAATLIAKVPKYTETTLGGLAVGTTIELNVAGVAKEFIVVHQGKPSDLYDDSCNGTWLLMKDIYESRAWHSSDVNDYANSDIHSYLNNTFFDLFDANIQSAIKEVKIPYVNGTGTGGSVASGANGLSAKIFLLSGYEVGFTTSVSSYFPVDGTKLDYFESGDNSGGTNRAKRIAYLNDEATYWFLRSPDASDTRYALRVNGSGTYDRGNCVTPAGIRPTLVLPDTTVVYVDSNGIAYDEQEYDEVLTDILGAPFTGGVKIEIGSYTGTGTYGVDNPNSLTFEFEPKLVFIYGVSYSSGGKLTSFIPSSSYWTGCCIWAAGVTSTYIGSSSNVTNFIQSGNSLKWYLTNSADGQLNSSGYIYNYVAIG